MVPMIDPLAMAKMKRLFEWNGDQPGGKGRQYH
jgi:hypothetical protein